MRLTYAWQSLFILTAISLALHLALAFLPGFQIDINSFFAWALRLNDLGLKNFYSPNVFTDYTPGYLYLLALLGFIKNITHLTPEQFYFLLKLPAILSEVTLGIICFIELYQNKLTIKSATFISSLIFFNLALIFNSSIWGQVDSVLTLFMLLAIYYLKKQNYFFSSITLGMAFLIKPQTLAIVPIVILFALKNIFIHKKITKTLILLLPAIIVILLLSLPFFPSQPLTGLATRILETAKEYPYTSLFAFNFWGIIGFWIKDDQLGILNLSYQLWGYLLLGAYWLMLSFLYFKNKLPLYAFASLATLGFYFLPTRVHERYLYPGLVFLVFAAIELRSFFLIILQVVLSIIYLGCLYRVYIYYNYIFPHQPVGIYTQITYDLIDTNSKLLSIVSTIVFIIITIWIIKLSYAKKILKSA